MAVSRVYLIILDGLGVGSAPDAAAFGDEGSDTLAHIAERQMLLCPTLAALGLGNLYANGVPGLPRIRAAGAHYGRLTEIGPGKDTLGGHWELCGIVREKPPLLFHNGFPAALIERLEAATGRRIIGNRRASGTEIIQELGQRQLDTGELIVYTSADSVLQIAGHCDAVPLTELYAACRLARDLLAGDWAIDRVIARPFTGNARDGFARTADRRDYALPPPGRTLLNELKVRGYDVIGLGKVKDIFAGNGFTAMAAVHGNARLMGMLDDLNADATWHGLAFCNLVDFDTLYGHRNDPVGFAGALSVFDEWLGRFLAQLHDDELLLITADHGNDPATGSTDHSREQVPLLVTSNGIDAGSEIAAPPGLFHVGKTIIEVLGLSAPLPGVNLLSGLEY